MGTTIETREEDILFEAREEENRSPTDILYVLARLSLLFLREIFYTR